MAITKVFPIHNHLRRAINYAVNPNKTNDGELTGFYNCRADLAYKNMVKTQKRYNQWKSRSDSVQGHHLIQSFKPHEATPEIAQKIAKEFAESYLSDKYEVAYGIHTDHDHVHIHYIINAVSFVDGKKYRNNKWEYREKIRPLSDQLCAKYGLSVIKNPDTNKSMHYGEWRLKQAGLTSWKDLVMRDIDEIISNSYNYQYFLANMKDSGYTIKYGKHLAFKPYGKERFVRGYKLGDDYTEEAIKKRIALGERYESKPKRVYKSPRAKYKKRHKLKGLQAKYYRLLYKMGKVKKHVPKNKYHAALRKELENLEQHQKVYKFLIAKDIDSPYKLSKYIKTKQTELDNLKGQKVTLQPVNKEKQAFKHLKHLKFLQDGYDMYTAGNSALFEEYGQYLKAKRNLFNLGYDSHEKTDNLIKRYDSYLKDISEIDEKTQACKHELRICISAEKTSNRINDVILPLEQQFTRKQNTKNIYREVKKHEHERR